MRKLRGFVTRGFAPHCGQLSATLAANETWRRMRGLGWRLWLGTGDIDEIDALRGRAMTALTANNALLNKELRKGIHDELIVEASRLPDGY